MKASPSHKKKTARSHRPARPPIEPPRLKPFWDSRGLGYFGYRLILTAKLFDNMLNLAVADPYPLTPPQVRVIAQLGLLGTGTVRSLAEGAFVDRAEVSRAIREMERLRLIKRVANKADARSSIFTLSAKGRRVYAETGRRAMEMMKSVLKDVSRRELAAMDRAFWRIANRCLASGGPDSLVARGWL